MHMRIKVSETFLICLKLFNIDFKAR